MKATVCICIVLLATALQAQDSSKLTLSGYAELYYHYDGNEPESGERPCFLYNHKKHNQLNLNLALLKAAYTSKRFRANLALMTGHYSKYNLAAEPELLQHVLEANLGYRFNEQWSIDAGILPSHIGLESAIGKDCWTPGRSLVAENSPYYETGIRLNYAPSAKWTLSALLLQGWQNIRETNSSKAVGTQVQFKPHANWVFNSSSFIGNEKPDSVKKQLRIFHHFSVTGILSPRVQASLSVDAGAEQSAAWFGYAALLRIKASDQFYIGARAEYYQDPDNIIVTCVPPGMLRLTGVSLNLDYQPVKALHLRCETRYFQAPGKLFEKSGIPRNHNLSVLACLAVSF